MEATPISVKPPSPVAPVPVAAAGGDTRASRAAGGAEGEPCSMNQLALTPNPKRQKVEESGEGNGCKHCACKKSRCLKLYCPCFAGGGYCSDKCGCQPCFNKAAFSETVQTTRKILLSRQKRMSLKLSRRSEANMEALDDAHHSSSSTPPKRGCNCKKSSCLKKYCDCYQDGNGCSLFCRCEDCRNPFGKNEGIVADDCKHYIYTGADLDHSEDEHDERSPRQLSPISKESSFQQTPPHLRTSRRDVHMFPQPLPQWQPRSWHSSKRNSGDLLMDDAAEYKASNHDWRLSKHEESYTISRCVQILNGMAELSQHEKSLAPDVFLQPSNREIFVSLSGDVRALWLRRKIKLLN